MIAVLQRAATLVEHLAAAGGDGEALRALAAHAGLPPATASRLLHDLCTLGWADQEGPRGRYRLGPKLQAFSEARTYRGRLLAAATPVLERLVRDQDATVVLAVLRGGHRLALLELGHQGRGSRSRLAERDDLFASASGRMLVAQLPWRARRRLVAAQGLPRPGQWPGVATWAELGAECAAARRNGWLENHPRHHHLSAVAVAVPDDEGGVAAIGVAVERPRWSPALVSASRRAAAAITRRMAATPDPHGRQRPARRSDP